MAASVRPDGDESEGIIAEINITPLTDVFLVLLIIFMVTSSVIANTGKKVDLPEAVHNLMIRTGRRVYKALNMSGYGRIDLRVTPEGRVFVIEANPNPDISYGCELPESAEHAGMAYGTLLQRILSLGMAYQAEWREAGV